MSALRAVLAELAAANYHRPGLRCGQLFQAAPATLAALAGEVQALRARHRPSLPTDPHHVTAWTRPEGRVEQLSLLTATGRYDDFSRDHDLSPRGKRFPDRARCPVLAGLLAALPHLVNARVNTLGPGARLRPHEEHSVVRSGTGRVGIRARFHLPLLTNPEAVLLLGGGEYRLSAGTVYVVNHGCVHAAGNGGDADRVHLVWDMLMTEPAAAVMFGTGELPGFQRLPDRTVLPVAPWAVTQWQRIRPLVPESERHRVDFLDQQ